MRKIISSFLIFMMVVSSVNISFAKSDVKGPDLVITDIRINNPYFHSGDDISFEIDVKNIGDEVCKSGWIWLGVTSGALTRKGGKEASGWAKKYLYPGEEMTWSVIQYVANSDTITGKATCNSANSVVESNKSNNTVTFEFKSRPSGANLKVEDIKVIPSDFKAGDKVSMEIALKNDGNMDIPYSEIDGELVLNNRVIPFKTVQKLIAGASVSFIINDILVDDTRLELQSEINFDRTISETNYDDNIFKKDIYSVIQADYNWDTVRIGGGGFVPHMALHKTDPDAVYIGTDVGGAHRYDSSLDKWVPITSNLNFLNRGYNIIQGLETDPRDSDTVYVAAGIPSGSEGVVDHSALLRSTDKGKSFTDMHIPGAFSGSKTKSYQSVLALDPNNSNVLYAICPLDGLFRTENAKASVPKWEKLNIPDFTNTTDVNTGMTCVEIDSREAYGGKSSIIYAALKGKGIYKSTDAGASFTLLEASPTNATQMKVSSNGELYVKTSMSEGAIVKLSGESWVSVAPYADKEYTSFDIHPTNERMMLASTTMDLFFTDNAGMTWRSVGKDVEKNFQAPWYVDRAFANHISFAYFDPIEPKKVWFGDWFGVWNTEDVTASVPKWNQRVRGLEEFCVRIIKPSPGKVRLFVGAMDNNGILAENLFDFPQSRFDNPWCQDTNGIDIAEKNPDIVVRIGGMEWGGGPGDGGYSKDGGYTWEPFATYPLKLNDSGEKANNGYIAIAADVNKDGEMAILSTPIKNYVYRTTDWGTTWTKVDSLPQSLYADFNHYNDPIESDTVNPDIFYAYEAITGNFYLSRNGGASFETTTRLPKADFRNYVVAVPEREGELFVAIGGEGLWYSKDYGKSFTKVETVSSADCFSIGKEAPGSEIPTLYIYGIVNGVTGIFRSVDYGKSWDRVEAPIDNIVQGPDTLKADRKDFGIIYMVKGGTGVYLGIPAELDIEAPRVVLKTDLDGQIVRERDFVIEGTVTEKAKVYCSVNGVSYSADTDENNKFAVTVKLNEGENTASFYAVDEKGHKSEEQSYSFTHNPNYIKLTLDQTSGTWMQKSVTLTGTVSVINSAASIDINGERVAVNPKTKTFTYTAPIVEGINSFAVTASDDNGNTVTEKVEMNYDTVAPSVTFENAGITTDSVLYMLKGRVSEACKITVGEYTLQIQPTDSFDFEIPLQLSPGVNNFNVVMSDIAGNKSESAVGATYQPTERVPQKKDEIIVYNTSTGVPVIDGIITDGEWNLNRLASKVMTGSTKTYSIFGMKGDSKYLYFAARLWDENLVLGTGKDYSLDTYELFFDPELNRLTKYEATDKQIRLGPADNSITGIRNTDTAQVVCLKTENGYIVEAAIPWEELGIKYVSGGKFGFDVSSNDNNLGSGSSRDGVSGWVGTADNYKDTSKFGTAVIE